MSAPRITPLRDDELSDEQAALLAPMGRAGSLHIFRTLVRHPSLYKAWMRFSSELLMRSAFPADQREVVILRVANRVGSTYEWTQHVTMGLASGLTEADIAVLAHDVVVADQVPHWDPTWVLLVAAVDELVGAGCIRDDTWAALAARFSTEELIELTLLAGHYQMLAGALASIGVQPEGDA